MSNRLKIKGKKEDFIQMPLSQAIKTFDKTLIQCWIGSIEDFVAVYPDSDIEKLTFKQYLGIANSNNVRKSFSSSTIKLSKVYFDIAKALYLEGVTNVFDPIQTQNIQ